MSIKSLFNKTNLNKKTLRQMLGRLTRCVLQHSEQLLLILVIAKSFIGTGIWPNYLPGG